ncbi:hypothetical protein ALMP_24460 [Streptomyces sp. A012304]|nr:hypothetical protein ALMP_24460 [Streptomyces sp. A012304]
MPGGAWAGAGIPEGRTPDPGAPGGLRQGGGGSPGTAPPDPALPTAYARAGLHEDRAPDPPCPAACARAGIPGDRAPRPRHARWPAPGSGSPGAALPEARFGAEWGWFSGAGGV